LKNEIYWQELENEVKELVALRQELSAKIHKLKVELNQHKKQKEEAEKRGDSNYLETYAYQMFGKRLKDLTVEEYKVYYNTRHKIAEKIRKANEPKYKKSRAYKMFGKRLKDLTEEERKAYNIACQKKNTRRRKRG
jgi:hypothetical protein